MAWASGRPSSPPTSSAFASRISARLHDDRLGRSLDRLFDSVGPELILAVVRHVVQEFAVSLDELHNDSTTVSFYGAYEEAAEEGQQRGRRTPAITWGHSKDHRPDLKQLLYILTISEDGGVPVYFTTASGNVVDDRTHCDTWDLLHALVGRPEFLYVADCKLASRDNLSHIATRGGRFVTVLPRGRGEDIAFRQRLRAEPSVLKWTLLYALINSTAEGVSRGAGWPSMFSHVTCERSHSVARSSPPATEHDPRPGGVASSRT